MALTLLYRLLDDPTKIWPGKPADIANPVTLPPLHQEIPPWENALVNSVIASLRRHAPSFIKDDQPQDIILPHLAKSQRNAQHQTHVGNRSDSGFTFVEEIQSYPIGNSSNYPIQLQTLKTATDNLRTVETITPVLLYRLALKIGGSRFSDLAQMGLLNLPGSITGSHAERMALNNVNILNLTPYLTQRF